jgi:hypothetical protein
MTHPQSRRVVVGAMSLAAFTGAAPLALANAPPDAALLALGIELLSAWAAENATYARYRGVATHEADAATDAAFHATSDVVDKIEALPATTFSGLRVKALAVSWTHSGEPIERDAFNEQCTQDVRLAASIVRDLLAVTGAA